MALVDVQAAISIADSFIGSNVLASYDIVGNALYQVIRSLEVSIDNVVSQTQSTLQNNINNVYTNLSNRLAEIENLTQSSVDLTGYATETELNDAFYAYDQTQSQRDQALKDALDALQSEIGISTATIGGTIEGQIATAYDSVSGAVTQIGDYIESGISSAYDAMTSGLGFVSNLVVDVVRQTDTHLGKIVEGLMNIPDLVFNNIKDMVDNMESALYKLFVNDILEGQAVQYVLNLAKSNLKSVWDDILTIDPEEVKKGVSSVAGILSDLTQQAMNYTPE